MTSTTNVDRPRADDLPVRAAAEKIAVTGTASTGPLVTGALSVSRTVLRNLLLTGLGDHVRFGAEFERYRVAPDDDSDGPPVHGHTMLEVVWTAIPA